MNFSLEYCNMLYLSTILLDAKNIVEFGTGTGASTYAFSEGIKITNGILWSVDIAECKDVRDKYKDNKNMNFVQSDSIEFAKNWKNGNIDILLCDSDHSYERVYGELDIGIKYNPKVIFIHDTLFGDGNMAPPYNACFDFSKKYGLKFMNYDFTHGFGILIK